MVKKIREELRPGQRVTSIQGRDHGREYLIVGFEDDAFLWVADGFQRSIRRPKKKNIKHLMVSGLVETEIEKKISAGKSVTDLELRRALRRDLESRERQGGEEGVF